MKTRLICLGLLLFFFPGISSAQFTLQDSLLVWYPFAGNATDASGNQVNGTINGASFVPDRFGNPNEALSFDGVNDFVTVPNQGTIQVDYPVTLAAWVYIENSGVNNIFRNCFQFGDYHGFIFNIADRKLTAAVGDGGPVSPQHRRQYQSNYQIALNTWYHVTFVIEGPLDMSLYVNGKRTCGSYSGSGGPLAYISNDGIMGRAGGPADPYLDGQVDDLRFYHRVLSKSEIRKLAGVPDQDTLICYGSSVQLDAGYGTVISWSPVTGLNCTTCSTPVANPDSNTVYQVITETNPGCQDTLEIHVQVQTCCDSLGVVPAFSASINFTDLSLTDLTTGPVSELHWDFGDGTQLISQPGDTVFHSFLQPGLYQVCLETLAWLADSSECRDTICQMVEATRRVLPCDTVSLNPSFSVMVNGQTVTVTDQSSATPSANVRWIMGDGTFKNDTLGGSFSYLYQLVDTFEICLVLNHFSGGEIICTDTVCQTIQTLANTAVDESRMKVDWDIAPNPSSGLVQINLSAADILAEKLEILDLQGRKLFEVMVHREKEQSIELSNLPEGMYVIRLLGNQGELLGAKRLVLTRE